MHSAAKGVFAAVGNVQEAILVLVILINIRHERRCISGRILVNQEDFRLQTQT